MYRFPDNSFTNATVDQAAQSPMTRLMDTGMIPGLAKPAVEQVPQLAGHFGMMAGDNPFTNATVGQAAESPMTRLMQSGMLANRRMPMAEPLSNSMGELSKIGQFQDFASPAVMPPQTGAFQGYARPAVMPPQTGQLGMTKDRPYMQDFALPAVEPSPMMGQTKEMRMPQDFARLAVEPFALQSQVMPSQAQAMGQAMGLQPQVMPSQEQEMGLQPQVMPPQAPPSPMQNYAGNMGGGFGQQLQGFVNPFGGIAGLGIQPNYGNSAQAMGGGIGQLMGQGQAQGQGQGQNQGVM